MCRHARGDVLGTGARVREEGVGGDRAEDLLEGGCAGRCARRDAWVQRRARPGTLPSTALQTARRTVAYAGKLPSTVSSTVRGTWASERKVAELDRHDVHSAA